MTKAKITNTPPLTEWFTWTDYEGKTHYTYFVEAESRYLAAGFLAARGIGAACTTDCQFYCEETHVPAVSPVAAEKVPAEDAPKVIDLGGRYSPKDYAHNTRNTAMVWTIGGSDKGYEAWQTVEYVNEAVYGGKNGYGVRVWERSVTNPFPVNEWGWDETGNQSAPAHGRATMGKGPVAKLGTGYVHAMKGHGYWSVWFPTQEAAKAFRDSVHKWQVKLPKFNPKEHV